MKLITTANKDINKEMMLVPPSFDPCLSKKIEFPISTSNKNIKKTKAVFQKMLNIFINTSKEKIYYLKVYQKLKCYIIVVSNKIR